MVAAQLRQHRMFAHRFDAFGQSFEVQSFGHRQDRGDHALLFGISIGLHHEGTVDLDARDSEPADRRDRGMAGAEIIQVDPASQLAQAP